MFWVGLVLVFMLPIKVDTAHNFQVRHPRCVKYDVKYNIKYIYI